MSDAFAARSFHWLNVLFPLCDLEGNEWEEHPKYCLTGEGNSVATKGASTVYSPWHDWDSTLVTNRVMDSGIHRISLMYSVPILQTISTMLGFEVLKPGADFPLKPPLNYVFAAGDLCDMAFFGACMALAPRARCLTRGHTGV